MSLPHVLLGLLADQARTGYDLERAMREELDAVWRAEYSQIYPTLARLRRAGFVLLRVLGPRRGPRRNLYRITAAGRRELRSWIGELPSDWRMKDEILARTAFLGVLSPAEREEAIVRQERMVSEEIARLRAAPAPRGFYWEARRGVIERLEASRRWLRTIQRSPAAAAPSAKGLLPKKR